MGCNTKALQLPDAGRVSFTELLLKDWSDVRDPCWQPQWLAPKSNAPQPLASGALRSGRTDVGRADVRGMASSFMIQKRLPVPIIIRLQKVLCMGVQGPSVRLRREAMF